MAISGTLLGDFASFNDACAGATVKLRSFEEGSEKVEKALNRMVDGFSGRRIITEATMMAEAIARGGGASTLTARELAVVSLKAEEAADKFRALGEDVPPKIQALRDEVGRLQAAAGKAVPPVNDLQGALSRFDGVLAAGGVHLGPEIRALGELGSASGKTATELGGIATAGLAVGAGFGGWKIGRAISEFFDLDVVIGNAAAELLGWGSVADQVAGAQADQLAAASKIAGFAITDLTTAILINKEAMQDARTNTEISADAVARWSGQIAKVHSAGDLASLTADLASQNFSLQELATRYGVSVEALQWFVREETAAAKAVRETADAIEASNAKKLKALDEEVKAQRAAYDLNQRTLRELTQLEEAYHVTHIARTGTRNQVEIASLNAFYTLKKQRMQEDGTFSDEVGAAFEQKWSQALAGVGTDFDLLRAKSIPAQQELAANALKTYQEMILQGGFFREDLDKQLDEYHRLADAARGYGDAGVEAAQRIADAERKKAAEMKAAAAAAALDRNKGNSKEFSLDTEESRAQLEIDDPMIAEFLHAGYSLAQAARLKLGRQYGFFPTIAQKGPRVPGFAEGGTVMVGEHGAEAVRLPFGSQVFPHGSSPGGGVTVHNVFHIVDTESGIARRVSDSIMRTLMAGRQMPVR